MQIPYPPDGPKVQAALQNMPTPQLQQYAAGQPPQPTGQVTPGPMGAAAEALNARGAMGAANQRQQAMQNNPANSPTIFQRKDAELAAMKQQMQQMQQQTQQKEQQLGVLGALMAKKAQDMEARESMGVATLPMRPDMFTAMDGGIVFSGGGAVQRFNGRQGSGVGFLADPRSQIYTNAGEDLVEEAKTKLARLENLLSTTSSEQARTALLTEIASLRNTVSKYSRVPSTVGEPEPTIYPLEPAPKKEDKSPDVKKDSSSTKTNAIAGASNVGVKSVFDQFMGRVYPYNVESDTSKELKTGILGSMGRVREGVDKAQLSDAERKKFEDEERLLRETEYGEYTKGREARREKTRAALEGEAPTFQERLGAGLKRLPTDLKGVRLGGLFGALGAGAAESDAEYAKRKREAAKYLAEAEELAAQKDLAEKRGDRAAVREFSAKEDARRKAGFDILSSAESRYQQGLGTLLSDTRTLENRQADLAAKGAGLEIQAAIQERLEAARAARDANKPTELVRNVQEIANMLGISQSAALALLKPTKEPVSPRDRLAFEKEAKTLTAASPELQPFLSDEVRTAIAQKSKALTDPSNPNYFKLQQEVRDAQDTWLRSKLYGEVPAERLRGYNKP